MIHSYTLMLLVLMMLVACHAAYANDGMLPETGHETVCKSDQDCYCRQQEGNMFVTGRAPSTCNPANHRCRLCSYTGNETNANTVCQSNYDCFCQGFDGTKFSGGVISSTCNMQAHQCAPCVYE